MFPVGHITAHDVEAGIQVCTDVPCREHQCTGPAPDRSKCAVRCPPADLPDPVRPAGTRLPHSPDPTVRWRPMSMLDDNAGPGTTPGGAPPLTRVEGRPAVLVQQWAEIVWIHWRVDPAAVAALLPPALTVDTFDGSAWVGLVPFEMRDLRPVVAGRVLPAIGSTRSFSEVNVRTYVRGPAGPGVWFHSLDATSRLAVGVARGLWALPYRYAHVQRELGPGRRWWSVSRPDGTAGRAGVAVDPDATTATDPLAEFLTARFRLYAPLTRSTLVTAPVRHVDWSLLPAELDDLDPGLVAAAGYRLGARADRPDHVVAGRPVDVTVGLPSIIRRQRRQP